MFARPTSSTMPRSSSSGAVHRHLSVHAGADRDSTSEWNSPGPVPELAQGVLLGYQALSSFLDNAPTYVVFFETAASMTPDHALGVLRLVDGTTIFPSMLTAISLRGRVHGGEHLHRQRSELHGQEHCRAGGVKMPSFFGYMLYSLGILVPLFLVVTVVFM